MNRVGPSSELCGTLPVTRHETRPDVHTYSIVFWHTFISVKTNHKLSRVTDQVNKKLAPHSVRSPPRQLDIKSALSYKMVNAAWLIYTQARHHKFPAAI